MEEEAAKDPEFAVIKLGKVAGKTKYSLVDQRDIALLKTHVFRPVLEVDPNGTGAVIFAKCYPRDGSCEDGEVKYAHDLIWDLRVGGVSCGWKVTHRNGVTVDNRLENLILSRVMDPRGFNEIVQSPSEQNVEKTVYYQTIKQLSADVLVFSEYQMSDMFCSFGQDGPNVFLRQEACPFYECHYPPCCNLEKEMGQFRICGNCRLVRYCGPTCQRNDWPIHLQLCSKFNCKPQATPRETFLDR